VTPAQAQKFQADLAVVARHVALTAAAVAPAVQAVTSAAAAFEALTVGIARSTQMMLGATAGFHRMRVTPDRRRIRRHCRRLGVRFTTRRVGRRRLYVVIP
jgi:hypothetical protein